MVVVVAVVVVVVVVVLKDLPIFQRDPFCFPPPSFGVEAEGPRRRPLQQGELHWDLSPFHGAFPHGQPR